MLVSRPASRLNTATLRCAVHEPAHRAAARPSNRSGPVCVTLRRVPDLPHQLAVLCYLYDAAGRVLMLHRRKPPNRELYSPIGGKVETARGESPTACAIREIHEEAGLRLPVDRLRLAGLVSENAYLGETHWLMFLYEVVGPVAVEAVEFDEGRLEWHTPEAVTALPQPETDQHVIWPLYHAHRGGFFAAHIDCSGPLMRYRVEQPPNADHAWRTVSGAAS